MADGFIAGWNAKYFYNFWRPVTAIQKGDTDGNPSTERDPGWSSAHHSHGSWLSFNPQRPGRRRRRSAGRFLRYRFCELHNNKRGAVRRITRSFTSFSEAALENANSRVFAGIHFRSATTDGVRQGEKIGKFIFKHSLKPVKQRKSRDRRWRFRSRGLYARVQHQLQRLQLHTTGGEPLHWCIACVPIIYGLLAGSEWEALSRILIGIHFRLAVEEGTEHGRKVAKHAVNLFLKPVK
jgi:hypothetical protein